MSYQPIWDGRSGYGGKNRHPLRSAILALLCLCLLLFGALETVIWSGAHDRVEGDPKVMVILGCQVKPWGPSVLLQDRLDTALGYLKDHPDMTVVCSGGQGPDEHISEAACMRDYLVEKGVPEENILLEDRSLNTWQNLNNSRQLLAEKGYDATTPILVVSNAWHLARVRMLYDRVYGSESLSTLAAPSSHRPTAVKMFFREPLALAKSFVFDK